MRLLHIIDSGGMYGAEMMLLNLMEEQVKQGCTPTLASIGTSDIAIKPIEAEALDRGFTVKPFRMRPGPNIVGTSRVLRYARREKVDILHSHGYKGNILFGFLPPVIRKIPMLTTIHGWTSGDSFSKLRLYEWLDSCSLRHIDAVVLVSQAMKTHTKLRNRKQLNLHIIPNGVPVAPTVQHPSQRLDRSIVHFCSKTYTIGAIGRLSPEKGFDRLIGALKLLNDEQENVRLIIFGEGPARRTLESQIRKANLQDKVLLPGFQKNVGEYFTFMDVFVMSSLTEGMPMTILEAMNAGVPIVSTRVGGVPELLDQGRAGILVEGHTADTLAGGIKMIKKDPEFAKTISERAKTRLGERYSSAIMAKEYMGLYKTIHHAHGNS